jgi:hypothetical protein
MEMPRPPPPNLLGAATDTPRLPEPTVLARRPSLPKLGLLRHEQSPRHRTSLMC